MKKNKKPLTKGKKNCFNGIKNPSPSNDPYFDNPENIKAIKKAIKQAKRSEVIEIKTKEELKKLLGIQLFS